MIREILNLIGLEGKQLRDDKISKASFVDSYNLEGRLKRIFQEDVSKMTVVGILNDSTTLIPTFSSNEEIYEEIDFILIELNSRNHLREISDLVQKSIPNPLIIIFIHKNEFQVSSARKRLSKTQKNSQVIESFQYSNWLIFETRNIGMQCYIGGLGMQNFSQNNLRSFYFEYSLYLYQSKLLEIFSEWEFIKNVEIEILDPILNKFQKEDSELKSLNDDYNRTINFAEKMQIKKEIIKISEKRDDTINILKKLVSN